MKWEITLSKFFENGKLVYKVTRHLPDFSVSETKLFDNEKDAVTQFEKWSHEV